MLTSMHARMMHVNIRSEFKKQYTKFGARSCRHDRGRTRPVRTNSCNCTCARARIYIYSCACACAYMWHAYICMYYACAIIYLYILKDTLVKVCTHIYICVHSRAHYQLFPDPLSMQIKNLNFLATRVRTRTRASRSKRAYACDIYRMKYVYTFNPQLQRQLQLQ